MVGLLRRLSRGAASRPIICRYCSSTASRNNKYTSSNPWYWNTQINPDEQLFSKVLIANRGEIACRIMNTCKRLGIQTVAVYSDSDAQSLHVRLADERVHIGESASKDSYLRMDRILEACSKTGAQAVHPGFGFLSENTEFAALLQQNNISFIGPPSQSIKAMGDKIESKRIAEKAGVNMIPGYDGAVSGPEEAVKVARDIGYPVMLKASAGGGGKGMRVAYNDEECVKGFQLSSQEAASSFGDDRILVEKFIECPRHIEIQILGDQHDNYLYLHERECSIQRRNQKVIEEAPSPFMDPETRRMMGEQAVALSRAVGYYSAGTVEFLVDANRKFYFLEMNTRLQVEHPITECITGIDIVHEMIRVANGHRLRQTQDQVSLKGSAIECRVYAEDPTKNFGLPSIGRLFRYQEPATPKVRCDSGVDEGSEISMFYDPMICKLVTYGDDRTEALDNMVEALDSYIIQGVHHNVSLLRSCVNESKFRAGDITTNYLYDTFPNGFSGYQLSDSDSTNLAIIAALVNTAKQFSFENKTLYSNSFGLDLIVQFDGRVIPVTLSGNSSAGFTAVIDGVSYEVSGKIGTNDELLSISINNVSLPLIQVISRSLPGLVKLQFCGTQYELKVLSTESATLLKRIPEKPKPDVSKFIQAPMAGTLIALTLQPGDQVISGQEACVLEAMKMQNSLIFATDGKVKTVNVKPGATVNKDDVIIELE